MERLHLIVFVAIFNAIIALVMLSAYAILRAQPVYDRFYFFKWYANGTRRGPTVSSTSGSKFLRDIRTCITFWSWIPAALSMSEAELINHAGLDSVVYIRIYLLGLKIFFPQAVLACTGLVLFTMMEQSYSEELTSNGFDKFSISNVPLGSKIHWAVVVVLYVVSFWAYYWIYKDNKSIVNMRLHFLARKKRSPDEFTVLVRSVPPALDRTVTEKIDDFFSENHPESYLSHQLVYNTKKLAKLVAKKKGLENERIYYERNPTATMKTGFCGLWGSSVNALNRHEIKINELRDEEASERANVISDPTTIIPTTFVSFKTRWGASVCAQTQQASNPGIWLIEWAPAPEDVCWENITIPYAELTFRRWLMKIGYFFLASFFLISIEFVPSLANIEEIEVFSSLPPLMQEVVLFIALEIFFSRLPKVLTAMAKMEGFSSLSYVERRSAEKCHLLVLIIIIPGHIVTGAILRYLYNFRSQSPMEILEIIGVSISHDQILFLTYIIVEGLAGIAAEVLRLNSLMALLSTKTNQDKEKATNPGRLDFSTTEPRIQLLFLIGFVYAWEAPYLLPFLAIFFAFASVAYRHQFINVYDQKNDSGGAFWPDVNRHIIVALIISQLLVMGLVGVKKVETIPFLIALPVFSFWFLNFCKVRFESAFVRVSLQDAMQKDQKEKAEEPSLNLRSYLKDLYLQPILKSEESTVATNENTSLIPARGRTLSRAVSRRHMLSRTIPNI